MKRLTRLGVLLVALAFSALSGLAQDANKSAAVKPVKSPSQVLLESWNEVGKKLIAIAEDLPEDKYEYKPNPESRTFAAQLLHATASMYFFTDPAAGKKPRYDDDPKRDNLKTKQQIVAFVKQAVQDGAQIIKSKGDSGINDTIVLGKQTYRISDLAWGMIEHSGEHYGQLVVYYRINGMVPPESRPKK